VNQRALARAIAPVLQGRKRDRVGSLRHWVDLARIGANGSHQR
jgi:hypothetical protein